MNDIRGLHLVTGEKGGVGKSLFAMVLLEYCRANGIPYRFTDADRTSADVAALYSPVYPETVGEPALGDYIPDNAVPRLESDDDREPIYFSEGIEARFLVDRLVERAARGLVIVNLPAQVEAIVHRWYIEGDIRGTIASGELVLTFWFVTDGTPQSLNLLEHSLTVYGEVVPHAIVVNEGARPLAMADFLEHPARELAELLGAKIITMPELMLSNAHKKLWRESGLTLKEAGQKIDSSLSPLARRRARKFLDDSLAAVGGCGMLSTAGVG